MNRHKLKHGFTLLELLIVVLIMAVVAGSVIMAVGDTNDEASVMVAQSEMTEIKQAILRFKQDTGYFPKTGPFDLAARGGEVIEVPVYVAAGEEVAWFDSPANFWQLYENPLPAEDLNRNGVLDTGEDINGNSILDDYYLAHWDPNTRRGWHGPYLSRQGNAYVDLGSFDPVSDDPELWNPSNGFVVHDVPAVCDPFVHRPEGPYFQSRPNAGVPGDDYSRWGRPYFVFDLSYPNQDYALVGTGPNGRYEGGGGDDLVLFLAR